MKLRILSLATISMGLTLALIFFNDSRGEEKPLYQKAPSLEYLKELESRVNFTDREALKELCYYIIHADILELNGYVAPDELTSQCAELKAGHD